MKGLKSQEYQLAKEEVVKLQAQIDAKRIEQIERISGTQSRQLTALEKVFLWGGLMSVVLPDVMSAKFRVLHGVQILTCFRAQARLLQLQNMQKADSKAADR
jgi:hypothetical protein